MKRLTLVLTALILALIFLLGGCTGSPSVVVNTKTGEGFTDTSGSGKTPSGGTTASTPGDTSFDAQITDIRFPARSITLTVGESVALAALVQPEGADLSAVIYTVADPTVFSYENGIVKALSEGSAALKASANGKSDRCVIIVTANQATTTVLPSSDTETETPPTESTEQTVVSTQTPVITTEPITVSTDTPTEPVTVSTETPVETTTVLTETPSETTAVPTQTPQVNYEIVEVSAKTVRHIFTHCLIIDPAKGCGDPHVYPYGELDTDCLTVKEFKGLLQSLYDNGFCLININDMYVSDGKGGVKLTDSLRIYKGKKPLVISIDDVTYDPRKKDCGMISRLVVDANGKIAGEIDQPDGSVILNYEECFCLLEEFLETHPDFSFEGNKFTLALTGFAGILGYRTDEQTANEEYRSKYKIPVGTDYLAERERVKPVVEWFKTHGYNFASHTYSHSDYTNCSLDRVLTDIEKWNRNVKPLIGETKVLVYPYGAFTYADTEKHQKLLDEGFVMFCGTSQLNTLWDGSQPKSTGGTVSNTGTIYLERFTVTGFTLRNYASRTNYINYYTDYYKELGNDAETARAKAVDLAGRMYDISHNNSLEYYDPNEIYDHEHRYYKILPET